MKVVRIIARLNVGGPARHVAWLTAGLRREGVEGVLVSGVVPPGEEDMAYFARSLGVEPVVIPEMTREISAKDAITVWKLYRLLVRERPDVVHTHTAKAGTVGRLAGMLYRWLTPATLWGRPRPCRFVHTYHGHIFHSYYGPLKTRLFLAIEKFLARLATDRIVVISPRQYQEIHERFGVGRDEQFRIIPLGLDMSVYDDWAARRQGAREAMGAREGEILVGIVGRLTEIKNHALFLEAAARYLWSCSEGVTDGRRRVRFVVIGDGHLRSELEARANALELENDVSFAGSRDDPESFYPALDVVALTSLNEGTPLTLIEAMANARPVISTAVGGVADLLGEAGPSAPAGDGWQTCERGVLVRSQDAEIFSRALTYLVGDDEARRLMGARGREFVERHYSLGRLLADVHGLYKELTGAAPRVRVARDTTYASRAAEPARLKGD